MGDNAKRQAAGPAMQGQYHVIAVSELPGPAAALAAYLNGRKSAGWTFVTVVSGNAVFVCDREGGAAIP